MARGHPHTRSLGGFTRPPTFHDQAVSAADETTKERASAGLPFLQRAVEASPPAGTRPATHQQRLDIFHEAVAIVEAEFSRPIAVDEVARRVATSPRQLHRALGEIGGVSFRSALTSVRMARAADLLAATDIPVAEVGRRVGYRQAGQFTKAFKRAHAMTPSAFRAQRAGHPEALRRLVRDGQLSLDPSFRPRSGVAITIRGSHN